MINKILFLHHEVILNNPSRETISAGLGPVEQYGIILFAFIIIIIISYFIKRRKKIYIKKNEQRG